VASPFNYRKDLYKGTAEYYDRFRPAYPAVLFDDLRARVPLHGDARVLDLACGPGPIALALAPHVGEVWAVDQEAEFIDFARQKSARLGVANIDWVVGTAEEVELEGAFDLVAIGNAFHRLDRDAVARRLAPHVTPGGCVALLWARGPNRGDRPWQRALEEALERWMNIVQSRDRVPPGWEEAMDRDPSKDVLQRVGFTYEGEFQFAVPARWSIESLTGFVYSTSFLSREALGNQVDSFAADLRTRLLNIRPDGVFEQDATFVYELARR